MVLPQFFIFDFGMDIQMMYMRARTSMEVCMGLLMSHVILCSYSINYNSRDAEEQGLSVCIGRRSYWFDYLHVY